MKRVLSLIAAALLIAATIDPPARAADPVKVSYPNLNGSYIYFFTAI